MDDYSKYYYQRIGSDKGDFGDISSRVQLRKDLQCKTFQWYLDNIFPELVSFFSINVATYNFPIPVTFVIISSNDYYKMS